MLVYGDLSLHMRSPSHFFVAIFALLFCYQNYIPFQVLEVESNNHKALYRRGVSYESQGAFSDALTDLQGIRSRALAIGLPCCGSPTHFPAFVT